VATRRSHAPLGVSSMTKHEFPATGRVARPWLWPCALWVALALCGSITGSMSAQLPDGPHLQRLRGLVNESNPTLRMLRANLAAADARARAAGYAPAMVAELEIEDVPGGLDLPAAGSIRLDVWKQVPNAARRSAQRAAGQIERETAELGMTAG